MLVDVWNVSSFGNTRGISGESAVVVSDDDDGDGAVANCDH